MLQKNITISLIILFLTTFLVRSSYAGDASPSLIRDAETEKFLRELSNPIFRAAKLNPQNIKIYIVNDDSLNAFVSGGQNVFVNTGLIRKYRTPDMLIGVIAHESGHIAAGHLARSSEAEEQAQGAMMLSYLLGIGAAVAGSPDAGMALLAGGSNTAERLYTKFTRTQEEAADNHAIEYLETLSYPADGLVALLEFFESEMIGYKGQIDEYLLSHPVSRKRINLIKDRTKDRKFSDQKINKNLQPQMDRVLAKLEGFIENPNWLLQKYKSQNNDLAIYTKSIAFFRNGQIDQSLSLLDQLIAQNNKDGFLFELKGQILFESGRVADSSLAYDKAIKLLEKQDAAQARITFAAAILALPQNDKDLINLAIKRLKEAQIYEEDNPLLFRNLASAYSKIDDEARSMLALAEFNCTIGQKEKCQKFAQSAKEKFKESDKTEILRADDLLDEKSEKDQTKK